MKFSDIPQETIDLKNSYVAKTKNNRDPYKKAMITDDSEQDAYNTYMRLYRLQAHRNKPAKGFSKTWRKNNRERNNEYSREWAANKREEMKEAVKRWQEKKEYKIGKERV